ncbi:unnamed protein product [Ilex paraguariensis]|uniref:C2H2-type domain-containing protein n=1 Tax=Ilex paraguariensis TaxID=185542 RepID=A0ABC8RYD7_9AQUA
MKRPASSWNYQAKKALLHKDHYHIFSLFSSMEEGYDSTSDHEQQQLPIVPSIRRRAGHVLFKCVRCYKVFGNRDKLKDHMNVHFAREHPVKRTLTLLETSQNYRHHHVAAQEGPSMDRGELYLFPDPLKLSLAPPEPALSLELTLATGVHYNFGGNNNQKKNGKGVEGGDN